MHNCLPQNRPDGPAQQDVLLPIHSTASRQRVQPSPMQGFIDVDVSQAGHDLLIQQGSLQRPMTSNHPGLEFPCLDRQPIRPQTVENDPLMSCTIAKRPQTPESSRILEHETVILVLLPRPDSPCHMNVRDPRQ